MKKILGLTLAATLVFTGCKANIDGEERDIIKIEQSQEAEANTPEQETSEQTEATTTYGKIYAKEVDGDDHIVDLVDMDEEIFAEGYESFIVDTDNVDFERLQEDDFIQFEYQGDTITEILGTKILSGAAVDTEGLVEMSTTPLLGFDLDIDRVSVYTDAEMADGEILFDDGNRFLVVAHSEMGDYVLMDNDIQLPMVNTTVYTMGPDLYINILEEGTAHINYSNFKYEDNSFIKTPLFEETENVNIIGSM